MCSINFSLNHGSRHRSFLTQFSHFFLDTSGLLLFLYIISHKNRKKELWWTLWTYLLIAHFSMSHIFITFSGIPLYFYSKKYRKRKVSSLPEILSYIFGDLGRVNVIKLLQTGRNVRFGQNKLLVFGLRLCPSFFTDFIKCISLYPFFSA